MRVALVTHVLDQPTRGNHTTVQRWLDHVEGIDLMAVPADPDQRLDPAPDVVHGYHALHGGVAARALARRYGRPLVISLGGTDLHRLREGDRAVADVLRDATCVTGAAPSFADALPDGTRYVAIPRGIAVEGAPEPKRPDGRLDVLLVAALRPVKDPLLALDLADALRARGLPVGLRILGDDPGDAYARAVRARAACARVPHEEMPAAYRAADVVWNTSLHEGGANALLEAVAHGCAVFARDVPGNRDCLCSADAPGRLFEPGDLDAAEASHRALLAETWEDRLRRAERGVAWLRRRHDPRAEALALVRLWRAAATP